MFKKNRIIVLLCVLVFAVQNTQAQTATVYHLGSVVGTYSTVQEAISKVTTSIYSTTIQDSIVLSPHTFYEFDINPGGGKYIIKGESTNASRIDAQGKGRVFSMNGSTSNTFLTIEDVIMENGYAKKGPTAYFGNGGGIYLQSGQLILRGYSQVRNCRSERNGGGIFCGRGKLLDHVKITNNVADSVGGGFMADVDLSDSVEISYNKAVFGGGCYRIYSLIDGDVLFLNNYASKTGGAIFFFAKDIKNARFLGNKAGKSGNALGDDSIAVPGGWHTGSVFYTSNCYFYNPDSNGKRNYEISVDNYYGSACWYGNSDTTRIIRTKSSTPSSRLVPSYVVADWKLNRGKTLAASDTLFPVQAGFKLNTGIALSAGSCRWLQGGFRATGGGAFLDSTAKINLNDTVQSMYRSFKAPPINKNIDFLAWVDADTFRTTRLVWGRDTTKLGGIISSQSLEELKVMVYPIPATTELHVSGAPIGSKARIFDMKGQQVFYGLISSEDTMLPIGHLASGNYILRISTANGAVGVAKVTKE